MSGYWVSFLTVMIALPHCLGCGDTEIADRKGDNAMAENTNAPEAVYRRFMLANLEGEEASIRELIVDNDDAHVLWQGAYPKEVAAVLREKYEKMEISRLQNPDPGEPERVILKSSASVLPIAVVKNNGVWKVDAGPIIEIRKAAQQKR